MRFTCVYTLDMSCIQSENKHDMLIRLFDNQAMRVTTSRVSYMRRLTTEAKYAL